MLKEIDLLTAVSLVAQGERVRCLVPMVGPDGEWSDMQANYLNECLDGMIFFADDEQVHPQEIEPAALPDKDPEPEPEPTKRKPNPGSTKVLDEGKIKALRVAGWSIAKIADEMGVSEPTIAKRLKKIMEAANGTDNGDQPDDPADGSDGIADLSGDD
jgi:DNA-binding NarL/FixJ family response regulator